MAKSYIDQGHIDIKDEIGGSVPFVGSKTLVKLHISCIENLFFSAVSINMVLTIGNLHRTSNTTRRRMDLSARQKNASGSEDMITSASKRSTKYQMSYRKK